MLPIIYYNITEKIWHPVVPRLATFIQENKQSQVICEAFKVIIDMLSDRVSNDEEP